MAYPRIDTMRADISKVYEGSKWKERVKYMSDTQVFAIWNKFSIEGKFKKAKTKLHNVSGRADVVVEKEDRYEQLVFDSWK